MLRPRRSRPRPGPVAGAEGFTLIEVVVAIAVMLILATAIAPSLLSVLDQERLTRGSSILQDFANSLNEFKADVQVYPKRLSHLPEFVTASDTSSCRVNYTSGQASSWNGPYVNRLIPEAGVPVVIGTARDTLVRTPPNSTGSGGGGVGILQIFVDDVTENDAIELNTLVDGDSINFATRADSGIVRWTSLGNGFVTLKYTIPVSGC